MQESSTIREDWGIGQNAQRLAFSLSVPETVADNMGEAIKNLKKKIKICQECFGVGENDLCEICSDSSRDRKIICVVERADEVMAIEVVGNFKGVYHVLGGVINPLEHIGPEDLKIKELIKRIEVGGVEEVILATNPTIEGEGTALYIKKGRE